MSELELAFRIIAEVLISVYIILRTAEMIRGAK